MLKMKLTFFQKCGHNCGQDSDPAPQLNADQDPTPPLSADPDPHPHGPDGV